MQSGNYNRSPNYGHKTKFQQSDGVFLQLSPNGKNFGSHIGCQNSPIRRNFCTSYAQNMYLQNPTNMCNTTSEKTTPLVKNTNSTVMPQFNGLFTGIRNIVNKLNCDFYSDHHRYYNPNYRNNYRMDMESNFPFFGNNPIRVCPPETSHFHQTVLYNLTSVHKEQSMNSLYHQTKLIPSPFSNDQTSNQSNLSTTNANRSENFSSPPKQDNKIMRATVSKSNTENNCVINSVASTMNSEVKNLNKKSMVSTSSSLQNQNKDLKTTTKTTENFALFDEDFPELPPPKVMESVSSIWAKGKPSVLWKKSEIKTPTAKTKSASPLSSSATTVSSNNTKVQSFRNFKETPTFCYFEINIKPQLKDKPLRTLKSKTKKTKCLEASHSNITNLFCNDGIISNDLDYDSDDNFILLSSSPTSSFCSLSRSSAGSTPFRPTMNCRRRTRNLSDCSDDGFFIYFSDDVTKGSLDYSDSDIDSDGSMLSDDTDEEDEDDDDEIDDEEYLCGYENDEEGVDEVDADLNIKKNVKTDQNKICAYLEDSKQPDSGFHEKKKVSINPIPEVYIMRTWDFAYRSARKGEWERFARDRTRFRNRINTLSEIIDPILDSVHREKIYRTRFCDKTEEDDDISIGGKNPTTTMSICQTLQI